MKVLFYFGHPSQYLFLKNPINILKEKGIICDIVIKSKDILEALLIENNESYTNILPEGRKSSKRGIIFGLIKRDLRLFKLVKNKAYDLFVGTDPSLSHIGFIKNIPVITVLEDDIQVIPGLARITFPFTSLILTPQGCSTGNYEYKTIHYRGFMKLSYLHPKLFNKKAAVLKQPYFLIRISSLDAYHDTGINGFNLELLQKIVSKLSKNGSVYISSEGILDETLKTFELKINPIEMQDILSNASLLISDSQSMTMEAAMLGVPSIRYSDFTGRINVLEELEHKYHLTFGIPTSKPLLLFDKIDKLLSETNLIGTFQQRRKIMLSEKIDVTAFMVWFIENYPRSTKIMKENPEYQDRFS
jgi:hypothetical protein